MESTAPIGNFGSVPQSPHLDVEQEVQEMMVIVDDLQRKLDNSRDLNSALQEELETITTQHHNAENTANTRAQEIKRLREDVAELQAEGERLMVELGASEEEREEAVAEIGRLKHEQEILRESILAVQEAKRKQERAHETTRRDAEGREQGLGEKIHGLETRMEKLRDRLDLRTRELYQANAMIEDLKRDKNTLQVQVNGLTQSHTALGKIHSSLKDVHDRMLKQKSQP